MGATALTGGLQLAGTLIGGSASKDAAKAQQKSAELQAANVTANTQLQIQAQQQATAQERADLAPWRQAGQGGLAIMQQMLGLSPGTTGGQPATTPATGGTTSAPAAAPLSLDAWAKQAGYNMPVGRPWSAQELANLNPAYNQYLQKQAATAAGPVPTTPAAAAGAGTAPGGMSPDQIMRLDPGYKFRLGEGLRSVDQASAAQRGPGLSGATLKELERYGGDYASSEFGDIFARASTLSGEGLGAATGQANFTQQGQTNNANTSIQGSLNAGNFATSGAAAGAAGTVGSANSLISGINNIGQQYTLRNLFSGNSAPTFDGGNAQLNTTYGGAGAPVYTI